MEKCAPFEIVNELLGQMKTMVVSVCKNLPQARLFAKKTSWGTSKDHINHASRYSICQTQSKIEVK